MSTSKQKRKYPRIQTKVEGASLTKQSFKDEVNINNIMRRFQLTGAIDHYAARAPEYGDATSVDLLGAQIIIANANTMFEELPSNIRKKFENNPSKFLDFVQDDRNSEEMIKLGLKPSPREPSKQAQDANTTQSDPVSTSDPDNPLTGKIEGSTETK